MGECNKKDVKKEGEGKGGWKNASKIEEVNSLWREQRMEEKKGEKDRHIKFNVLLYTVKLPNLEHWTNIGTPQNLIKLAHI